MNLHSIGDGWNGEDMSLFSYDDTKGDEDLLAMAPHDLKSLMTVGARAIKSWCRPYPVVTAGIITRISFDYTSGKFELLIDVPSLQTDPTVGTHATATTTALASDVQPAETFTEIFLPFVHYISNSTDSSSSCMTAEKRLLGERDTESRMEWQTGSGPGRVDLKIEHLSEGKLEVVGQRARWYYPLHATKGREIRLELKPWNGAGWHENQA